MDQVNRLHELTAAFADSVAEQSEAIMHGDAKAARRSGRRYVAAFQELRAIGDAGRDALCELFTHPRRDVRVMAAACMLRYRTQDALRVLEDAASGEGLSAFGASEAIKRWNEGSWSLDPP